MHPVRTLYLSLPRLLGALAVVCLAIVSGARGQVITISENFTGTTAPGWVFGGTSGSTIPYLTANTVDSPGNGWLRLTESLQNQSTYALFDQQVFSVNAQIDITLEYTFWNGHNNLVQDGKGADGMTFFLVDASRDAGNFQPGAFGGSLGYAQKTGIPGLADGYLGFGFDNWGNFAGATEGRVGGLGNTISGYENRISVRGPDDGDGNNATGWDFIAASASLSSSMDFPLSTTRPNQTGADYRAFHLTLDANNQLTVEMKFGATSSFVTAFTADLAAYQRPDFFKIGFTAGTGNADETHEIRNVEVAMTPFQAGAFEWDNGAGTTVWGATPGGANNNWYHADSLLDNLSPTPDSDILFAQRPLTGPQTVELNTDLQLRSFTFDTSYNYTLTGSGVFTLGNTGLVGLPSINVNDYNGAQARHKINNSLVLVEELRINNYSLSTLCLNGTISLSANDLTLNGTGAVNFNAALVGSGNIIKNGSGLLTINADSSAGYSGNYFLNAGQTVITSPGALGNTVGGTTVASGASLTLRGGVNYTTAETVTISGDGWAFNGRPIGAIYGDGGTSTFAGNLVLAANSTVGTRDGTLNLTGSISGAFGLTKLGYGVVNLTNANNSYTGSTSINAGVLRISTSSNSLPGGFATGAPSGGNLVLNGGVLEIGLASTFTRTLGTGADQVQFTGDGGFSAFGGARSVSLSGGATLSWSGTTGFLGNGQSLILSSAYSDNTVDFQNAINLNGAARTVRVDDGSAAVDARLSGILSGTGTSGLVKSGSGTLELTGANTYTGTTEIQGGALRTISTSLPGGYDTSDTANNFGAVNLNGGVLELASNTTFTRTLGTGEEQIHFGGSGGFAASGGARTVSLSGGATLTWNSTSGFLTTGTSLILGSNSSDNTLTFQNALNLNGAARTITVQNGSGAIDAQLTGVISNGSLTISGAGVLTSTAANTFAGTLSVSGAEFRVGGSAGTVNSITALAVQNGGTFTLDNSAARLGTRLANSATISLSGGTLQFLGFTSTTTESAGAVTLMANSDNTIIAQRNGSITATLTFSSLTRVAGATVNFSRGSGGGTFGGGNNNSNVRFVTAPTLNDGILAYATVNNDSFATHAGNNTSITAATTTTTSLNTASISDNVGVTAATISVSADRTINSLRLDASSTITISNGVTLNIESGGLLARSGFGSTITGGTLTARGTTSGSDLIVHVAPTATLSISSVLANNSGGSVGLTKANTGTLILSGSTANTLTGDTTVNGGILRLAKSDSVTALAGNITVGDRSGLDRLELGANEQIADTANVTLNGSDAANRATLDLGGFTETFATLAINGNAVLDFDGGGVCAPAFLYLDDLLIAGGSTLLVKNWIEFTTFLLVKNTSANTEAALPKIQFEGYGEAASWLTYDSTWSMIAPVPEPSTYGAILLGAGLAFVAWRRRAAQGKVRLS